MYLKIWSCVSPVVAFRIVEERAATEMGVVGCYVMCEGVCELSEGVKQLRPCSSTGERGTVEGKG